MYTYIYIYIYIYASDCPTANATASSFRVQGPPGSQLWWWYRCLQSKRPPEKHD